MKNFDFEVITYPIKEPKSNTVALANAVIGGVIAIHNIQIREGRKGLFVKMPQSQSGEGKFYDIAFPLSGELRKEISDAVLEDYNTQIRFNSDPSDRLTPEQSAIIGRETRDIALDIRVYPLEDPKGETLAFASVGFDDTVAIRGIRVLNGKDGYDVSMPQTQGRGGRFKDVAFPLSDDLRKHVTKEILAEYDKQAALKKQSISQRIMKEARPNAQSCKSEQDKNPEKTAEAR